jgi:hypothetical protein
MLKLLSALAVAVFVVVAAPSVQAAPASAMLAVKATNSVVEPVYWRYHRHWHHYRYWRHPVYWRHRHWHHYRYWRHPYYWRHHHYRYYRYWGPARRHCGWWW